eukprot:g1283.t1
MARQASTSTALAALAIVDCGSGSSRVSIYSLHADDGFVHEDRYIPSNLLPTLAPALAAGGADAWVESLAALLAAEKAVMPVVVGSTGGLRKAMDDGTVTEDHVMALERALVSRFDGRARLEQLSGSAEAALELRAVRYVASHALPLMRPQLGGPAVPIGNDEVGVLSCGGMSSQIVYRPAAAPGKPLRKPQPRFLSLRTNLLGAMARSRREGLAHTLAHSEDRLWATVASAALGLAPGGETSSRDATGKLRGTFVVIELAGSIGKEAGLGHRLVPKREAVQLLTLHLGSMLLMAGKDRKVKLAAEAETELKQQQQRRGPPAAGETDMAPRTEASISWYQEARPHLAQIVLALLDLFSSEAWFYFATSFHVDSNSGSGGAGSAAGHVLRTQWPLGLFLRDLERSEQLQSKL